MVPGGREVVEAERDSSERGHWRNPVEFLLSTLGYAVGMGSVWRFPYLVQRNGGGAFLIPYFIFAVIFGIPLFFMESALGQYFQRSPILAFDICPLFRGVAVVMCLLSLVCMVYYVVIMSWSLYFLYSSFSKTLPWTTCGNPWNTNSCLPLIPEQNSSFNASGLITKPILATEEFWEHNVLGRSQGVEHMGNIQPHLALALLVSWACIYLCIFKGITSSRIAVYITATLPFLLLIIIFAWTATFPGAVDGMLVYITPDWQQMKNHRVWLEAFIQVFYSIGTAWGGVITLSSYNPFHQNCLRDSIIVTLADTFTSLFCGFVIFSGLGYMAHQTGVPVLDVVSSGPGLSFVTYPQVVSTMPVPQLWASLFFILLFFLGIDSAFGMVKTVASGLFDMYPETLASRKAIVTSIVCVASYLAGLLFVTEGGVYYFQLCDWYLSFFAVMLGALLECLVVSYLYGIDKFLGHIKDMLTMVNKYVLVFMKYSIMFEIPIVMATGLIFTVVTFRSPSYGDYVYPEWTSVSGWLLGTTVTLPIPGIMVYQLLKAKGTLVERFRQAIRPRISRKGHQEMELKDTSVGDVLLSKPHKDVV